MKYKRFSKKYVEKHFYVRRKTFPVSFSFFLHFLFCAMWRFSKKKKEKRDKCDLHATGTKKAEIFVIRKYNARKRVFSVTHLL